jgi:hypothetical protein
MTAPEAARQNDAGAADGPTAQCDGAKMAPAQTLLVIQTVGAPITPAFSIACFSSGLSR